jgi:hypothetical protein
MRASIGTVAVSDGSGVARLQGLAGVQRSILVSVTLVYLTVPYLAPPSCETAPG